MSECEVAVGNIVSVSQLLFIFFKPVGFVFASKSRKIADSM